MLDIDRWFQALFDLFNSTNLQLVLLVGSGILAVSLLLLAMTHWGQSRPVWKCVVLSFIAHILLMGYAYGTRLLGPPPTAAEHADIETDEMLNVSLMDDTDFEDFAAPEAEANDNVKIAATKVPNQNNISAPNFEVPDLAPLDRPEVDTEFVIETKQPEALPTTNQYQPKNQFQLTESAPKVQPKPESVLENIPLDNDFGQQLAMLPKGKIVDPETIDVQREQFSPAKPKNLEIDFGGELTRPEIIREPIAAPDANAFVAQEKSFVPQVPEVDSQPAPAPPWSNVAVLKPIPRPNNRFRKVSRTKRLGDGKPVPRLYSLR